MKKKVTIYQYYSINFLKLVFIPVILIFLLAIFLVLFQSGDTQIKELDLTNKLVADSLKSEISQYSVEISSYIIANNQSVLSTLTQYANATINEKYLYSQQMQFHYNASFLQLQNYTAFSFYLKDTTIFALEHKRTLPYETVQNEVWYEDALANPDKIRVCIQKSSDILQNPDVVTPDSLLSFALHPQELGTGSQVDMISVCIESETLMQIKNADTWAEGVSIILTDDSGNVIYASDDKYTVQDADTVKLKDLDTGNTFFVSQKDLRTGYNIITVKDYTLAQEYINIILLIAVGIIIVFALLYIFFKKLLERIITPINELSNTMQSVAENAMLNTYTNSGFYEISVIEKTYNNMAQHINNLLVENKRKEREKHEEEMKVLELQFNPHFLSNTLGNIRFMAIVANFESIRKMTESLINILDVSFRNSTSFHPLSEELEILNSYIYIMTIRYANNFDVNFDVGEDCKDIMMPKLLLQPFIENSITHGFEEKDTHGKIDITIKKYGQNIRFNIRDNGNGMSSERIDEIIKKEPKDGKNIGVSNINKRLELYFGVQSKLKIKSVLGEYCEVCFDIPVIESKM